MPHTYDGQCIVIAAFSIKQKIKQNDFVKLSWNHYQKNDAIWMSLWSHSHVRNNLLRLRGGKCMKRSSKEWNCVSAATFDWVFVLFPSKNNNYRLPRQQITIRKKEYHRTNGRTKNGKEWNEHNSLIKWLIEAITNTNV